MRGGKVLDGAVLRKTLEEARIMASTEDLQLEGIDSLDNLSSLYRNGMFSKQLSIF